MGIFNEFFSKLDLLIEKSVLESGINSNRAIMDMVLKTLEGYDKTQGNKKIYDKDYKYLVDTFYKNYRSKTPTSKVFFSDLIRTLKVLDMNLDYIDLYIKENMNEESIGGSLSFKKGFAVAFASNTGFALDCIILLIDYYNDVVSIGGSMLIRSDVDYLEKNIAKFATIYSDLTVPNNTFVKEFDALPDVQVTELNQELLVHGNKSSFSINKFMGFRHSPVLFLGKLAAAHIANKYKERKEKIKYLELRLKNLENENSNTFSPQIEKEIAMTRERVEKMEAINREVERNVGEA